MIWTVSFLLADPAIFLSNISDVFYAIQRCLTFGTAKLSLSHKIYSTSFSLNTYVMKVGFNLCAVFLIDFNQEEL